MAQQEEVKVAIGGQGSLPFTMWELLGKLKKDGEVATASSDSGGARSALREWCRVGSAGFHGSSYRLVLACAGRSPR